MNARTRALAVVPIAVALFGLVGCGGGEDSADSGGDTKQSAQQDATGAEAQQEEEKGEKKEPPLTGEIKAKAEEAALAAVPGTVVKSEEDQERPGEYAVEIQKEDGSTVEVYMDKSFKITTTKEEGTEEEEEGNG